VPAPCATCRYLLLRTTGLCALNPFAVGFTHGTVLMSDRICAQTAGAAPGAANARARKNVPARARNVNVPVAVTRARPTEVSLPTREPLKIVTVADRPWPACTTRPVTLAPLPAIRAVSVTPPGAIAAGDTTAPVGFAVPAPGV
jgi:hypothetical protein